MNPCPWMLGLMWIVPANDSKQIVHLFSAGGAGLGDRGVSIFYYARWERLLEKISILNVREILRNSSQMSSEHSWIDLNV